MKICIIGNSQMACLKQVWPAIAPTRPDLSVGFFGAPGEWLDTLAWIDGRIASPQKRVADMLRIVTGGEPVLNPGDWDAFVLVGLSLNVRPYRANHWLDRRLSAALRRASVQDSFAITTMAHVRALLRSDSSAGKDRPMLILPNPLARQPQPGGVPLPEPGPQAQSHAEALADLRAVLEDADTRVLAQPEDTILHDRWTRPEFGEGAVGLATNPNGSNTKGPDDRTHMNAAFGARLWQVLLADPAFSR